jgi:hypothetical protein
MFCLASTRASAACVIRYALLAHYISPKQLLGAGRELPPDQIRRTLAASLRMTPGLGCVFPWSRTTTIAEALRQQNSDPKYPRLPSAWARP